jgi:hypothetical protein
MARLGPVPGQHGPSAENNTDLVKALHRIRNTGELALIDSVEHLRKLLTI